MAPSAPFASKRRLLGFVAIGLVAATAGPLLGAGVSRVPVLAVYASAIAFDLLLVAYCWTGLRRIGLPALGLRWEGFRSALDDVAAAVPAGLICLLSARGVQLLIGNDRTVVAAFAPRSGVELAVWLLVSLNAGLTEELVFRGYLQRELVARTGRLPVAILVQAATFAVFHSYQGWRSLPAIGVFGLLFGALAAWRGNLRANILAHVAIDVLAGVSMFVRPPA